MVTVHQVIRVGFLVAAILYLPAHSRSQDIDEKSATPILWQDPGPITARDMRVGPGARHLAPVGPFTFVKEDKGGESPKFEVKDARGTTWVVKLGEEAQAETVATRLVWSVGYFTEEAYYLPRVRIRGMKKLSRGMDFVGSRGLIRGARFAPR